MPQQQSDTQPTPPAALPVPPWRATRTPRRPARARPVLSKERIVEAALKIADVEGLDAVTVRRIADEFGTGPASLYTHITGKEELFDLMLDLVAAEITVPEADPDRWSEQVKQVAWEIYRVLCGHADVARIMLGAIPAGPNMLRVTEGLLDVMIRGGVPVQLASWTIDRLLLYIASDAYQSSQFLIKQPASGLTVQQFATRFLSQIREFYSALPGDQFPHTRTHAAVLTTGGGDERFEFGLSLLIDGLVARLPTKGAPGGR
jgi:AcrR family transcriptional regulator